MSITDRLESAAHQHKEAARRAVYAGLDKERDRILHLGHVVTNAHSLEIAVAKHGNEYLFVLPKHTDRGFKAEKFETDVESAIAQELTKYGSLVFQEHNGFIAYKIETKKKLPEHFGTKVQGLKLDVKLVKVDIDYPGAPRAADVEQSTPNDAYKPTSKRGLEFDIELNNSASKYHLIPMPKDAREHFPGYKVPFVLVYDGKKRIITHVTGARKSTPKGALAGTYASKGIKQLYDDHPELKAGMKLHIKIMEPGAAYKLISAK